MDIASADENDNHVIPVRKYKSLRDAMKKVVCMKIGKLHFKMSAGFHAVMACNSKCKAPMKPAILFIITGWPTLTHAYSEMTRDLTDMAAKDSCLFILQPHNVQVKQSPLQELRATGLFIGY